MDSSSVQQIQGTKAMIFVTWIAIYKKQRYIKTRIFVVIWGLLALTDEQGKKKSFPDGESNPGRRGESAES